MDPALATAVAYTAETAVEAGVAGYFLTQPTLPLKATLQHLASTPPTPRCSHSLSIIGDRAYIFGGSSSPTSTSPPESNNDITELEIATDGIDDTRPATVRVITAIGENGQVPAARRNHTAVVARNRIFVFGGSSTGGVLEEDGRIWVFDPRDSNGKWLVLEPPPKTEFPSGRVGHSCTVDEKEDVVFIHGGTGTAGTKLSDTWAWYLEEGRWTKLADVEGTDSSGVAMACGGGKLWRFGGDGEDGVGSALKSLDVGSQESHRAEGVGSLDESKRTWTTIKSMGKDRSKWPEARKDAALHYITRGHGRDYIVLALGEGSTDYQTGDLKGKHLQDIWSFQIPSTGFSGATVKDTIRENVPGVSSHEGEWAEVEITKIEVGEGADEGGAWTARSGFGSAMAGTKQFILWGGVNAQGEVLGDGWWVKI